jgi:hypothetical protein
MAEDYFKMTPGSSKGRRQVFVAGLIQSRIILELLFWFVKGGCKKTSEVI